MVQVLNLRNNNFGAEGTIALAEALKVSFVFFRELSAFSWLPRPSGNPPFLTRLDAQVNKTVQVLNLELNSIGDEGTVALAAALKVSIVLFRECSAFSWLPPSLARAPVFVNFVVSHESSVVCFFFLFLGTFRVILVTAPSVTTYCSDSYRLDRTGPFSSSTV